MLGWRFCGGVDSLKLINEYMTRTVEFSRTHDLNRCDFARTRPELRLDDLNRRDLQIDANADSSITWDRAHDPNR